MFSFLILFWIRDREGCDPGCSEERDIWSTDVARWKDELCSHSSHSFIATSHSCPMRSIQLTWSCLNMKKERIGFYNLWITAYLRKINHLLSCTVRTAFRPWGGRDWPGLVLCENIIIITDWPSNLCSKTLNRKMTEMADGEDQTT